MITISFREDFWNGNSVSSEDLAAELAMKDGSPRIDGAIHSGADDARAFVQAGLSCDGSPGATLLLIHGYNNQPGDVIRAYEMIEGKLSAYAGDKYDNVVGIKWPAGDDAFGYWAARRRAILVAPRLVPWLRFLLQLSERLDVMVHSMGARVVLNALDELHGDGVALHWLYMCAAAVDNKSIEAGERYHDATKRCERVYVFHSRNDDVLAWGYPIAEWYKALGYSGPADPANIKQRAPHVRVVNCKGEIESHAAYKRSDALFRYIDRAVGSPDHGPQFDSL